jgi:predicted AlkP superfamily pyrophosphatase or phosphodiesterase
MKLRHRARPPTRASVLLALAALSACAGSPGPEAAPPATTPPRPNVVLLVSIDGFRADYLDRGITPNLLRIGREGVRAEGLRPSFPTKTFPNHYSMVTGLVPDHHGIVANNIWDPDREESFGLSNRAAVGDARWWGGEPVWIAAEKAGLRTAPLFWPGSEAPIGGLRPTNWLPYEGSMTAEARIEWLLDRIERPPPDGVAFATLYFDDVDGAGHRYGPEAPATDSAIARVDAWVGLLLAELDGRGLSGRVDILVTSDHGMSATSRDRVILLDDSLDLSRVRISDWNPLAAIWPAPGEEEGVYESLRDAHPHLRVWKRDEVPDRLAYGSSRRVAPVLALADPGWSITTRARYEENPARFDGGNHGYDNAAEDMLGLFVARGPDLHAGIRIPVVRNVDLYPLLMTLLGLAPRPADADPDALRTILRWSPTRDEERGAVETAPPPESLAEPASADLGYVLRLGAAALFGEIELDLVALFQRAEAVGLDLGEVDEGVTSAIVERHESETLLVVEPLHGSLRTRHRSPSPAWIPSRRRPG